MLQKLEELKSNALKELAGIARARDLESWRVRHLGKKSELTRVLRSLATLPIDQRKAVGSCANQVKANLEESFRQKGKEFRNNFLSGDRKKAVRHLSNQILLMSRNTVITGLPEYIRHRTSSWGS